MPEDDYSSTSGVGSVFTEEWHRLQKCKVVLEEFPHRDVYLITPNAFFIGEFLEEG